MLSIFVWLKNLFIQFFYTQIVNLFRPIVDAIINVVFRPIATFFYNIFLWFQNKICLYVIYPALHFIDVQIESNGLFRNSLGGVAKIYRILQSFVDFNMIFATGFILLVAMTYKLIRKAANPYSG